MSILNPRRTRSEEIEEAGRSAGDPDRSSPKQEEGSGRGGHSHWMMLACCVPMLVIAISLVATGVVGAGFIVVAIACTAMMAMMMIGMSGGGR